MAITIVDSGTENGWYWDHIDFQLPSSASIQADDVAFLFGTLSEAVDVSSYPTGYTEEYKETGEGIQFCAYKVLTGSESGTVTVNLTANEQCCGNWVILRGVDTSVVWDVASGTIDSNFGTAPSWNAITPTTDGAWVLAQIGAANDSDQVITWDGSLTEIEQTPDDGSFSYGGIAYEELDPAASSGNYTGTSLASSTGWATMLSAVRPASTGFSDSFAGSVASAGSLDLLIRMTLTSSTGPAGTVDRQVSATQTGTIGSSGSLAGRLQSILSGSIGSAGVLTQVHTIKQGLAGVIGSSGAVTSQLGYALSGAIGPTGTVATRLHQILAGTLGPTGSRAVTIKSGIAAVVSSAGTVVAGVSLSVGGTVSSSGVLSSGLSSFRKIARVAGFSLSRSVHAVTGARRVFGFAISRYVRGED